jgi:hypothetical protein
MQDPAEPVMEVVLFARTGQEVEARGHAMPVCAGPVGIDVRDWRGLSERIADHEDVRLQQLQNPEPVEDL